MSSYIINAEIPFIESATEVKKLLKSGWELWYLHNAKYSGMPGKWQMRHRDQIKPVSWDAIVKMRRNIQWLEDNLEVTQDGLDWVHQYKQKDLFALRG